MPKPMSEKGRSAIVVMGVSGAGKSACGAAFARDARIAFVDGDDLHPPANVAKMSAGHPLTDEDRWPWLDRVGAVLADRDVYPRGVVVACSALRRRYRDRIRAAGATSTFVFLDISPEEARRRLLERSSHFMPPSLVDSQFATLERPQADETDVVTIEEHGDVETTVRSMLAALGLVPR